MNEPTTAQVETMLRTASDAAGTGGPVFRSQVFGNPWDRFVESWTPRIYRFVAEALGPYGTRPLPDILPLAEGMHAAGATASFDMRSGQVRLATSTEGNPGQILEKLCHEFTHGALANFPEGDPFYEEGFVDYSVWVMAHAPMWGQFRQAMIDAASFNIKMRRERALVTQTDYDRKRWAGGLYASIAYGPMIIARLRNKKLSEDLTW
jgi:hypothetical protein